MLHIIRMLERHFPQHARWFVLALLMISLLVLLAGIGLFAARWA